MDERPLLVIMHDPPEVLASPDPRTGKLELHNTWLVRDPATVGPAQKSADSPKADSVKSYVSEAVKNGFAVIDVNLPKHITEDEVSSRPTNMIPIVFTKPHHRTIKTTKPPTSSQSVAPKQPNCSTTSGTTTSSSPTQRTSSSSAPTSATSPSLNGSKRTRRRRWSASTAPSTSSKTSTCKHAVPRQTTCWRPGTTGRR
jgi:hypothetical protein